MSDDPPLDSIGRDGTPRWVKVFVIIFIVVILLVVVMLLTGDHGPGIHIP